jgi:hypothetical protein
VAVARVSWASRAKVFSINGFVLIIGVLLSASSVAWSREPSINERSSSLAIQLALADGQLPEQSITEKILSAGWRRFDVNSASTAVQNAKVRPLRNFAEKPGYYAEVRTASLKDVLLPGAIVPDSITVPYLLPSSPQGNTPVLTGRGAAILDSGDAMEKVGGLIADPSGIFPSFDILVDKKTFTLTLYGMKGPREGKELFLCKVGIGSAEYPTPKGTYYLLRIYDDNPLWIPPPSDWAWGMAPSHSVYGGHMLPLFKKIPGERTDREEIVVEPDSIDSKMKIIDSGGYRLHGTDSPWSVGSNQSHGCIRMRNIDVKGLSELLKLYVGITGRDRSPNGPYANLARPVKVTLY